MTKELFVYLILKFDPFYLPGPDLRRAECTPPRSRSDRRHLHCPGTLPSEQSFRFGMGLFPILFLFCPVPGKKTPPDFGRRRCAQLFGFGLKRRATRTPRKMAAAMPPAVLVTPPVTAPNRPFSATASLTPLARL